MAIKFDNITYNIKNLPSKKRFMVSFPMNMYRVETNSFEHGFDFFEKTILKLKVNPKVTNQKIADYLGIDERLVFLISSNLKAKKYLNQYGSLSDKGKEKLNELDGLVINSGKKSIGYVFQFINENELYPYYISDWNNADRIESKFPQIITGTKGDDENYTEAPLYMLDLFRKAQQLPPPKEKDIFECIRNLNTRVKMKEIDNFKSLEYTKGSLAIKLLNQKPTIIWVCTYVYLEAATNGDYESGWKVLDPFFSVKSDTLKYYLTSLKDKKLNEKISTTFSKVKTNTNKLFSEFQIQLQKEIESKVLSDFSFELERLDNKLQNYTRTIIENLIRLEQQNYNAEQAENAFILGMQKALENILKTDKEERQDVYERVCNHFGNDKPRKRNIIIDIFNDTTIFSARTSPPHRLLSASKKNSKYANSLLSYFATFVLTYHYEPAYPLIKIFDGQAEFINAVSELRNPRSHGQTENERPLAILREENIEALYNSFKSIILKYIKNQ